MSTPAAPSLDTLAVNAAVLAAEWDASSDERDQLGNSVDPADAEDYQDQIDSYNQEMAELAEQMAEIVLGRPLHTGN